MLAEVDPRFGEDEGAGEVKQLPAHSPWARTHEYANDLATEIRKGQAVKKLIKRQRLFEKLDGMRVVIEEKRHNNDDAVSSVFRIEAFQRTIGMRNSLGWLIENLGNPREILMMLSKENLIAIDTSNKSQGQAPRLELKTDKTAVSGLETIIRDVILGGRAI